MYAICAGTRMKQLNTYLWVIYIVLPVGKYVKQEMERSAEILI